MWSSALSASSDNAALGDWLGDKLPFNSVMYSSRPGLYRTAVVTDVGGLVTERQRMYQHEQHGLCGWRRDDAMSKAPSGDVSTVDYVVTYPHVL